MKTEFKPLTHAEFLACPSETGKYQAVVAPYLMGGLGVDIASQGATVCDWAFSMDLPEAEFLHYSGGQPPKGPIHLRGHADKIPIESNSLAFAFSSHFIEDFPMIEWGRFLVEWARVVRPGGYVIILCPERARWAAALARGQIPNCAHRHEPLLGELSAAGAAVGLKVVEDRLTDLYPEDYTILCVLQKP